MKRTFLTALVLVAVAGCGGGGGDTGAKELADKLGCPDVKVSTEAEPNEPPRAERAECDGLTIVTFDDAGNQDAYVSTVIELNKAFGEDMSSVDGDGWAVLGDPDAVDEARAVLE
jgi:hypothetical protein